MDLTSKSSTQEAKSGKMVQKKKANFSGDKSKPKVRAQHPVHRTDRITRSQVKPTAYALGIKLPLLLLHKLKPGLPDTGTDQKKSTGTGPTTATTTFIVRTAKAKTIRFGRYQEMSQPGRKTYKKPSPVLVPTIESSSGEPGPTERNHKADQHCPFPLPDICGIDNEGAVAGLFVGSNTMEKTGAGNSWNSIPLDLTVPDNWDSGPLDLATDSNNDSPELDYNNNATPDLDALLSKELDQLNNVCSAPGTSFLAIVEDNVEPNPGIADDAENQDSQMHMDKNEVTDEDEDAKPKKKKSKKIVPAKPRARSVSRSVRAGVTLPVGLVHRQLRHATCCRLSKDAAVFLTGVLEYLVHDIFTLAEEEMRKQKKNRITPKILDTVVRCDAECSEVWKTVMIPECGGGGVSKFSNSGRVPAKRNKNAC